eukprot:1337368-Prorocentrum_lima.AAC.1
MDLRPWHLLPDAGLEQIGVLTDLQHKGQGKLATVAEMVSLEKVLSFLPPVREKKEAPERPKSASSSHSSALQEHPFLS